MGRIFTTIWTAALLLVTAATRAEVRLPHIFSDGMVLQREMPVKVWGMADPGEELRVELAGAKKSVKADSEGKWSVTLPALKAGGPYTLKAGGIEVKDVLAGDVWLCSGQSNMELPIKRVTDMFAEEVAGYENPKIRQIAIPRDYDFHGPKADVGKCAWTPLDKNHVMDFSAVAYFFAKQLYKTTGVPIGIINSSVGGSRIEEWISDVGLEPFPRTRNGLEILRNDDYYKKTNEASAMQQKLWQQTLDKGDQGFKGQWNLPGKGGDGWQATGLFSQDWAVDADRQPVNGSVWLRRTFSAEGLDLNKEATLRLGCIVDADFAYVNGKQVGATYYQYPPRIYTIPAGLLHEGENTIVVRVVSNGGTGSFVQDKPYKIVQQGREISLEIDLKEGWEYKRGMTMPPMEGFPSFWGKPTGLYNTMLAPLYGYGLKGAIWYQGESNASRHWEYKALLEALTGTWRQGFAQAQLPFLIVQLPNFMQARSYPSDGWWPNLREAQSQAAAEIPHTALVVTIDAGEWNDIHPLDKKTVGERTAWAARRIAYGEKLSECPVYASSEIRGDQIIISFTPTSGHLKPNDALKGFAVAGADKKFVWAKAHTDGDKVVVWADGLDAPRYVRYAWADNPEGVDLVNTDDMPASPFRTDNK